MQGGREKMAPGKREGGDLDALTKYGSLKVPFTVHLATGP